MRADSERVPPTQEAHVMGYGHRHGEEHADVGMGKDGIDPGDDKDKIAEDIDILSEVWNMKHEKPDERDQHEVSEIDPWTEEMVWEKTRLIGNKNIERFRWKKQPILYDYIIKFQLCIYRCVSQHIMYHGTGGE